MAVSSMVTAEIDGADLSLSIASETLLVLCVSLGFRAEGIQMLGTTRHPSFQSPIPTQLSKAPAPFSPSLTFVLSNAPSLTRHCFGLPRKIEFSQSP